MKKLAITSGLVLAALILSTGFPSAKNRATLIHFTKNNNQGTGAGQYPAECIGVISTETLGSLRGDRISWKVRNGNGFTTDDICTDAAGTPIDKTKVELRFMTDVMGAAAMKKLTSNAGGSIDGKVSMNVIEAPPGANKYRVFYKGLAAGPDPEIDVECPGCGLPVGGPGPGH